jgi:peroxiredoxin
MFFTEHALWLNLGSEKDVFAPGKVQIIGLSTDSVQKQKAFVEKHRLTVGVVTARFILWLNEWQYPVLSDVNKEVIKALKVGSGMMGLAPVARVTYIIDKKGIVRCVVSCRWSSTFNNLDFIEIVLMPRWIMELTLSLSRTGWRRLRTRRTHLQYHDRGALEFAQA